MTETEINQMFKDVLLRLPQAHLQMIAAYPMRVVIRDLSSADSDYTDAARSYVENTGEGFETVIELDPDVVSRAGKGSSFAVARELAHIVLGHGLFLSRAPEWGTYDKDILNDIKAICEEQADFLAIETYGYREEAIALAEVIGPTSLVLASLCPQPIHKKKRFAFVATMSKARAACRILCDAGKAFEEIGVEDGWTLEEHAVDVTMTLDRFAELEYEL